jgi:hypothetical protein
MQQLPASEILILVQLILMNRLLTFKFFLSFIPSIVFFISLLMGGFSLFFFISFFYFCSVLLRIYTNEKYFIFILINYQSRRCLVRAIHRFSIILVIQHHPDHQGSSSLPTTSSISISIVSEDVSQNSIVTGSLIGNNSLFSECSAGIPKLNQIPS